MIGVIETIKNSGNVVVESHDAISGRLLSREIVQNHIPLVGRNLIRDLLIGDTALTAKPPSFVAIGADPTPPADSDIQLGNEVYRNVITQKTVSASAVTWKFFVPALAANGSTGQDLYEACLCNSSGLVPVMPILSRVTHAKIRKTANITLTYSWTHTLTASP